MHRRLVLASAAAVVAATLLATVPDAAEAQRVVVRRGDDRHQTRSVVVRRHDGGMSRSLTLSVGALRYRPDGDDNHPMAAIRGDFRLRDWLWGELGASYALADLSVAPEGGGAPEEVNSSLVTGTIGVRAELPISILRPYVGAAVGVFGRFDDDADETDGATVADDGNSFVRPTFAFPVGVRLAFSPRVGLRAEARFRFDEHPDGRSRTATEQTVGVSFGF